MPVRKYQDKEELEICELYKKGLNASEICLVYGCKPHNVYQALRRQFIKSRPREESKTNNATTFWSKVNIGDINSCWIWQKVKRKGGYGHVVWGNKDLCAHRVAYELWYEETIPIGLEVCHICDNPSCCNPHHLFLGTTLDNMQDKVSKERQAKGEFNGKTKLIEKEVIEIRKLYKSGLYKYKEIGEMFCVSKSAIAHVVRKECWGWL